MLKATNLSSMPGLKHGFFTRATGHSLGLYESLNCGFGSEDDQDAVAKNRAVCAEALGVGISQLLTVHQQHTADAVIAENTWEHSAAPVADALVSTTKGLALAILTADCVPVLFAEPQSRVIGAAHAGWKGAINGVIKNTIEAMINEGAQRTSIRAAIGPCIGAASYEVGPEFLERFIASDPGNEIYFKTGATEAHFLFDIGSYVEDRIRASGLTSIERIEADTYTQDKLFFSYRRSCHRSEPDYGRQLSGISWAA